MYLNNRNVVLRIIMMILIKQQKTISHPKINYKKLAIINLTSRILIDDEMSKLKKGFNYALAP